MRKKRLIGNIYEQLIIQDKVTEYIEEYRYIQNIKNKGNERKNNQILYTPYTRAETSN